MAVERVDVQTVTSADPAAGARVAWSGIFGGVVVGVGLLLLLAALGVAIGITAVDPANPDADSLGTGAAIWTGLTLLLALFVGGWSAARMSMLWDRTAALFQGTLVWALSMLLILWLAVSGISLVAGQTFSVLGSVTRAAGSATGGIDLKALAEGDADKVLATLRNPSTAQQIATATGMDRQQVSQRLSELTARIEQIRSDPAKVSAEVRNTVGELTDRAQERLQQTATEAQPAATRTAWSTFGALLLGLIAGMVGAAVGRRHVASDTSDLAPTHRRTAVRG